MQCSVSSQIAFFESTPIQRIAALVEETDEQGRLKRSCGYTLALKDNKLVWHSQKVEAVALDCFIRTVQKAFDDGIPTSDILTPIIGKPWFKEAMIQHYGLRQRLIELIYEMNFRAPLRDNKVIVKFLADSRYDLQRLLDKVGQIQIRAVEAVKENLRKGNFDQEKCDQEMAHVIKKAPRSPRMGMIKSKEILARYQALAFVTGYNQLSLQEKEDIIGNLDVAQVARLCGGSVFLKNYLKRPEAVWIFNGRSVDEFKATFLTCETIAKTYLKTHKQWEKYRHNLAKLITGKEAKQAYEAGEYSDCLLKVFDQGNKQGNLNELLSTALKEFVLKAFNRLEEQKGVSDELKVLRDAFLFDIKDVPVNWAHLTPLIKKLAEMYKGLETLR